jgi:hypothetical protein
MNRAWKNRHRLWMATRGNQVSPGGLSILKAAGVPQ